MWTKWLCLSKCLVARCWWRILHQICNCDKRMEGRCCLCRFRPWLSGDQWLFISQLLSCAHVKARTKQTIGIFLSIWVFNLYLTGEYAQIKMSYWFWTYWILLNQHKTAEKWTKFCTKRQFLRSWAYIKWIHWNAENWTSKIWKAPKSVR